MDGIKEKYYVLHSFCHFLIRIKRKYDSVVRVLVPFRKKIVFGRVACLGREIFLLRHAGDKHIVLVNHQKVRVDLLREWFRGGVRPKAKKVRSHLARPDIYPLIREQERLPWFKWKDCDYILMDSFSELTDQRFTHKYEGWSFCCHYSDIKHSLVFDSMFECCGLLPISEIEDEYSKFFSFLKSYYPDKPIVFLHYPTVLDDRRKYRERGDEIFRVMNKMEKKYPSIINVYINDDSVRWHEGDRFPYHYSRATNDHFVRCWREREG